MTPLESLNPQWLGLLRKDSGEGFTFDCPTCGPSHRLTAYFKNPRDGATSAPWLERTWQRDGETFATLTIAPSLHYPCWHGWVEDGRAIHISEAPAVGRTSNGELVALSPRQLAALRAQGLG